MHTVSLALAPCVRPSLETTGVKMGGGGGGDLRPGGVDTGGGGTSDNRKAFPGDPGIGGGGGADAKFTGDILPFDASLSASCACHRWRLSCKFVSHRDS